MSEKYEIVYVLRNEAMPNLIKIGKTQRKDLQARMSELYSTGVPFPFECLWAGEVRDCSRIESLIHNAFRNNRVNPKREFFNIEPDQVIPLLQELAINELTFDVDKALNQGVSKEEQDAPKQFHRPMLNFEEMNIPVGSTLVYVKNSDITSTVTGIKKVTFEDVEFSLTALTRKLLDLPYNVAPCRYWTYEGKNLQNIYDETYTNVVE
ncbi:MAG: GIY-YIG nuclease family protein [Cyanobacteria bacterium SIG26]|nr:GIY-YIG nuclease family protein [Cyanobacteria bacterium SIG26]